MTPVADTQVIEGVGEQWKGNVNHIGATNMTPETTNNNNNNNIVLNGSVTSECSGTGSSNDDDTSDSASFKSSDIDTDDAKNIVKFNAIPIQVYPTEFINDFNGQYTETLTNGEIHVNGFHDQQQQHSGDDEPVSDLTPEDLARLVRHQFEYYFSRENLSNDIYLASQMDDDQYVPITTVAGFKQIKKLTSDMDLIVDALKESPYIQMDSACTKVRANMKRCIVILREIPESTPLEELQDLFTSEKCPKWSSCEFVNNDSWYVTFASEEDAQKAFQYIRQDVRTFHGRPIMARIKAKTLLSRTVFMPKNGTRTDATDSPRQTFTGQQSFTPNGGFNVQPQVFQQSPYQYYVPAATWLSGGPPHFFPQEPLNPASSFPPNQYMSNGVKGQSTQRHYHGTGRSRRSNSTSSSSSTTQFRKEADMPSRRHPLKKADVPRFQRLRQDRERRQSGADAKKADEPAKSIDLAPENFPALPSPKSPSHETATVTTPSQPSNVEELITEVREDSAVEKTPDTVPNSTEDRSITTTNPSVLRANFDSRMSYAQMAQRPTAKSSLNPPISMVHDPQPSLTKASATQQSVVKPKNKVKANGDDQSINGKLSDNNEDKKNISKSKNRTNDCDTSSSSSIEDVTTASTTTTAAITSKVTTISNKDSYAAKSIQNLGSQCGSIKPIPMTRPRPNTTVKPSVAPLKLHDTTQQSDAKPKSPNLNTGISTMKELRSPTTHKTNNDESFNKSIVNNTSSVTSATDSQKKSGNAWSR